jgi:Reverse transcriptase (RNA-dependent DNA polymerase)/Endonuclease-reverse transcriptase
MSEEVLKTDLKIAAWNCRGIIYKLEELLNFVISENIDIVLLSETFLNSKFNFRKYGFLMYRLDRITNGGGVAIIIRTNITHRKLEIPITNTLEAVAIQITIRNQNHSIVSAYKPPHINLNTNDIDKIMSLSDNILIAGDLNCKDQLWYCSRGNRNGRLLRDHCEKKSYRILFPDSPTHFPPKGAPSILDIVVAKGCHSISPIDTSQVLSSDHIPIIFTVGGNISLINKTCLNYNKANWNCFKNHINVNSIVPENITSTDSIDLEISNLTNIIKDATALSIPIIKNNLINKNILPCHILDIIKLKNKLFKLWRKNKSCKLKSVINALINEIKIKIKLHKNESWESKLKSLSPNNNSLWQMSRAMKNKSNSIPPLRNSVTQEILYSNKDKANLIAETFAGAHHLTQSPSDAATETLVTESITKLNLSSNDDLISEVSIDEISNIIRNLKNKKSPGHDNINNTLLKHLPRKALACLTKIFNACLILGYFPTNWKNAKVIPIFKSGLDKSLPSSYRPISLLPSMSKLLERIILTRMRSSLDALIPEEQFGFKSGHCTSSQLTRLTQHVRGNFNHKKSTGMLLLDFSKAFDVVWHDGIIHKLVNSDTPTYITRIIQSYLSNRQFSVHTNDAQSVSHPVTAGVPQGSILGPFLFNLFIHDIPTPKYCQLALYADDTAIFTTSHRLDTISRRLQSAISLLTHYYLRWKLKLNESKTEAIIFTHKRSTRHVDLVTINDRPIPWSSQVKYLGLILDSKLNWSKHIKYLGNKANIAINTLYPLINRQSILSSKNKLLLYKVIIRPILVYGCPAWSTLAKSHLLKLQIIQNKCLKMAFNTAPGTYLADLHNLINLKTVAALITDLSNNHYVRMNNNSNPLIKNVDKTKYVSRKRKFSVPMK